MNNNVYIVFVIFNLIGLVILGGYYSYVVIGNGMIFILGQLFIDVSGNKFIEVSFEMQVLQVLVNVEVVFVGVGSDIGKLLQVCIYFIDVVYWFVFNDIYVCWVGSVCLVCVVVLVLVLYFGLQVEVEVMVLL